MKRKNKNMPKDIFDLTGKNIIVTGGLGLIGREYLRALANKGAIVLALDIVSAPEAEKLLNEYFAGDERGRIHYFQGNITDRDSLVSVRDAVLKTYGHIDGLVNNAALNPKVETGSEVKSTGNRFEDMLLEDWNREMAVNVTGTMLCCQVFGAAMKSGASIINISSTYGLVGPDQRLYAAGFIKPATYSTSKGAVVALTKYLAAYWGNQGIRVNCVALGGVENSQDAEFVKRYSARTPLGRMARSNEYQGMIVYLSSDASSYCTGSVLSVDGGWTAW